MTNFKRLQSMSVDELSEFLRKLDDTGIEFFCNEEYCRLCEDRDDKTNCRNCKYKNVDTIKWWLEKEST
ncbi:MAG: hypothetical protein K5644_01825 [Lachnospiraceae bacterium]|nr:hypothetical protein [Lachnospiraceae bacterium]